MKQYFARFLSFLLGKSVFGYINIGDIFIDDDEVGNPFVDPMKYKKVLDIKDGYIKYAAYSTHHGAFVYEHSFSVRSFLICFIKTDKFKG